MTPLERMDRAIAKLGEDMQPFAYRAPETLEPGIRRRLTIWRAMWHVLVNNRGGADDLTRGATPDEPGAMVDILALADAINGETP